MTVNILQGKISQTQDGSYGNLFIHIDGEEPVIADAIQFIKSHQVYCGGDFTCLSIWFPNVDWEKTVGSNL